MEYSRYISTFYIRLLRIPVGRHVLINRRKALKLLDFLSVQKRIYAKLTPLTPKIQAHYRVTEIGTCFLAGADFLYSTPLGGDYC